MRIKLDDRKPRQIAVNSGVMSRCVHNRGQNTVLAAQKQRKDVPLEVAIGLAVVNGVPMPVSGVPSTISEICERWVKISPGRKKKEAVANKISESTGLSHEDVLSCLPPGGCSIEDKGLISP